MELLGLQLWITITESTTNTILLYWCKLLLFVFQFCLLLLKILKPFLHSWVYTETLSEESLWFDVLPKKSSVKNDYLSSYKKPFFKKLTLLMWVQKSCKRNIMKLLRDRKVYKPVIMKITWYTKSFRKNDYESDGCPTKSSATRSLCWCLSMNI